MVNENVNFIELPKVKPNQEGKINIEDVRNRRIAAKSINQILGSNVLADTENIVSKNAT